MTLSVFDAATAGFHSLDLDFTTEDVLPTVIQVATGDGSEQRAALQSVSRRRFGVTLHATTAERNLIDEFWRQRQLSVTAVLFSDPSLSTRTGVAVGTSIASQVVFTLPTSGENSRDYPRAGISRAVLYDDGVAMTTSTINVDARTITVTVAPTSGSIITGDYEFHRLVRLEDTYTWRGLGPRWFSTSLTLYEVPA